MKKTKKWLSIALASAVMAGLLAGCGTGTGTATPNPAATPAPGGTPATGAPAKEQVLKYGSEVEPAGFDPHTISETASLRVINQLYETLVDLNDDMTIKSELAETWEIPDDTTYIFHLKQGVKFHSGREMTAEDVKYTFERILGKTDAGDIGALGNKGSYFGDIKSVDVVDPYTVKITINNPNAAFLVSLTSNYGAIVDKDVIAASGDLMRADGGTGPFKLGEWKPDNYVSVVKNEDYWMEGAPKLDGINFYLIGDEAARLAALRTGDIDVTTLSSMNLDAVEGNADLKTISYQTNDYTYLGFNLSNEALKDVRVRQAISLAINRQEIIDYVYDGNATVSSFMAPGMGHWVYDPMQSGLYEQDIERAKQLLADAGYADGLTLNCAAGLNDEIRNQAIVLKQQLEAVGITLEINNMESAAYVDAWGKMNTPEVGIDVMSGFNGSGTDPNRGVAFFFSTTGGANVWGYSNARVDELCALGLSTTDVAKREEYYNEAQKIVLEECPNLFIASPMKYFFIRSTVDGFQPTVINSSDFRNTTIQ